MMCQVWHTTPPVASRRGLAPGAVISLAFRWHNIILCCGRSGQGFVRVAPADDLVGDRQHIFEKGIMQLRLTRSEAAAPEAGTVRFAAGLPIDRAELEKLARWIPAKEWRCCASTAPEAIPI